MPHNYFVRYLPLLFQSLVAIGLAIGMVVLSALIGKKKYSKAKFQPYECGITPTGDARERFSVKFYLVGMLFILFDVEAVFLYPWAVILKELKMFGFWEMLVYVAVVFVGLFYIWKKGVLDWNKPEPVKTVGIPDTPDYMLARFAPLNQPVQTQPLGAVVERIGS